jgi:hypothetical protein
MKATQATQMQSGLNIGFLTGALAWTCCISAIVLGFLGLSAASGYFAMLQMKYHWWLVGFAFISMDFAIYYYMKRYHGSCSIKTIRRNYAQIIFIVLAALASYFLLQAIFPPLLELANVPM